MKTSTLFKSIATVALGLMISVSVFGQITGSAATMDVKTTAGQETDYVTIGSTMQYQVTPFDWGSLAGTLSSGFKWEITAGAAGTAIKTPAGAALSQIAATGFYTNSSIGITFTTAGSRTLQLTETGVVTATSALTCAGTPVDLPIEVLQRPKALWNAGYADPTTCAAVGFNATIPLDVDGSNDVTVMYRVVYTDMAGTPTTQDLTQVVATGAYNRTNIGGNLTIPAAAPGTYVVTLTGVYDNVSEKSFNLSAVGSAARIGTAGTDYSNTAKTFMIYPAPVSNPIQHIQNL